MEYQMAVGSRPHVLFPYSSGGVMTLIIRCPSCDAKLRFRDPNTGKRVRCPKCRTVLSLRTGSAAHSSTPVPPHTRALSEQRQTSSSATAGLGERLSAQLFGTIPPEAAGFWKFAIVVSQILVGISYFLVLVAGFFTPYWIESGRPLTRIIVVPAIYVASARTLNLTLIRSKFVGLFLFSLVTVFLVLGVVTYIGIVSEGGPRSQMYDVK
jgi:hypothetical protein